MPRTTFSMHADCAAKKMSNDWVCAYDETMYLPSDVPFLCEFLSPLLGTGPWLLCFSWPASPDLCFLSRSLDLPLLSLASLSLSLAFALSET